MIHSFEFFLARRYLSDRQTLGGALSSFISIAGVAVGVAALVVTLGIMTGFRTDIQKRILGAQPHILVNAPDKGLEAGSWADIFNDVKDFEAYSPYVMGQALLKKGSTAQGVIVKGVDAEGEARVTELKSHMKEGAWADLFVQTPGAPEPIFLAKELAKSLEVLVGDEIFLTAPKAELASLMSVPRLFKARVAGIVETGLYDYDSTLVIVNLPFAQKVFDMPGRYSGLGVRVKDPEDAQGAAMRIQKNLGSAGFARSWLFMNRNLFSALALEKLVMFIVLALITVVAAFTIISNLLLVTAQKVREIGMLKAMGATRGSIQRIFLMKGVFMGMVGITAGMVLGLVICAVLKRYQFIRLPADVYYIDTLPVIIVPADLLTVALCAFLIVLASAVYPAHKAASLETLSALRQM
jgi:lipoprotein-releasing system permease protein